MKNFKKLLSALLVFCGLLILNPMGVNAEWKQDSTGWWYTEGNSYAIGWIQINGHWYYFDNNGYMKTGWIKDNNNWYYFYGEGTMAHDTTIDGCYLNGNGAWITSISTSTSSESSYSADSSDSQTAYLSTTGTKYHKIPNCGKMNTNSAIKTTVGEAKANHQACEKCW